ncbi:Hypothetical predicted protein [Mytilus galloprovincialis]|uniref:Uncharacterized protein n=1 Tax=Mytilus galloprovincialis TaxID=29158 RepID=A0A8B6BQ33_MYTGA|nr:Hypothetical predicted protein [Mytilus galloprovincialis]
MAHMVFPINESCESWDPTTSVKHWSNIKHEFWVTPLSCVYLVLQLKLLTVAVRDVQSGQVTIMARLDSFIETFQCRDCIKQVVKEYKIAVKLGSTPCKEKPKASKPEEQPSKPEEPIKDHQPCDLSGIEVNEIEEDKTALDDASEPLEHSESNIDGHMFSLFKREMAAEEKTKFWMDTIVIKMNDKIRGIKNGEI